MDFFAAQERAHRNSRWLHLLFFIAVFAIISLFYVAIVIFQGTTSTRGINDAFVWWQPDLFINITASITLFVAVVSLYKIFTLSRDGGSGIAESLGGRRVLRDTTQPLERRLLNIVDEMSIAASLPVPAIFILDNEGGINAFAAGSKRSNSAVAVTEGTLKNLSRDELQGVIAHEFSHILNGDMATNIRLIGVLHGIHLLALIGRRMLFSTRHSRNKNSGGAFFIGLGLMIVGYIGVFFSRLIKAAISRQREYLADASAVQFTRNPNGIANALKKIAGIYPSTIHNSQAEMLSHMYFETGIRFQFSWFLTHPPIEDRIKQLDPTLNQELYEYLASRPKSGYQSVGGTMGFAAATLSNSIGHLDDEHIEFAHHMIKEIPPVIVQALRNADSAMDIVLAIIALSNNDKTIKIERYGKLKRRVETYYHLLQSTKRTTWLPIIELAIAAIKESSYEKITQFIKETKVVISADNRVTLFEYCVLSLVKYYLEENLEQKSAKRVSSQRRIREDIHYLLSFLSRCDGKSEEKVKASFSDALALIPLDHIEPEPNREKLSLNRLEAALKNIETLSHRFRGKIIEAAIAAIQSDSIVSINEAELIRVLGARFDCPIPPLLPQSDNG